MTRLPSSVLFLSLALAAAARADFPEQLRTPESKPPVAQGVEVVEHLNEQVPLGLKFKDENGKPLTLREAMAGGKPVVLTLVYFECPMLCNLVLQGVQKGLLQTGLQLGKDFRALTVSIDPSEGPDRAERHQYAMLLSMKGGAPADWPFLTGQEPEIAALAKAIGFGYRYDAPTKQFAHPAVTFVLTPDGRLSRYLYGIEFPARDLRLAIVEAAAGRVGTTLDRVLLSCFRWDPATRRYEMYLKSMIRGGGLLIFAALLALLIKLWRRELKTHGGASA